MDLPVLDGQRHVSRQVLAFSGARELVSLGGNNHGDYYRLWRQTARLTSA
jgi:hypothetical protein